jgi:hypothetical protein
VPARGRDLERTPRAFLASQIGEIEGRRLRSLTVSRHPRLGHEVTSQISDGVRQVPHRHGIDPRQSRLRRRARCAEHPRQAGLESRLREGEHPADRPQPAIERELAHGRVIIERAARDLS